MRVRQIITVAVAVGLVTLLVRLVTANKGSMWVAAGLYALGLILLVVPGLRSRLKGSRNRSDISD